MQELTSTRLRMLLLYDPVTGVFRNRFSRSGRAKEGNAVGTRKLDGRITICVDGKDYYAHRLAWLYMTGSWPGGVIDHLNGDNSMNSWNNLRDVPQKLNLQNQRRAHSDSEVGLLGVSWHAQTGQYRARIYVDGRNHHLGLFDSAKQAHLAYMQAKRALHQGCTI